MPIILRYILVIVAVAVVVTAWALAVTRWKKWSGGCGMCSMLKDGCCMAPDRDETAKPDQTPSPKAGSQT